MPIHEEDYESGTPREDEWADLYVTGRSTNDIIAILGGYKNNEDDCLKFDNNSQRK